MSSLRERREARHLRSPRYEIIPTSEVHDGPEEVMRYFRGLPPTQRPLGIAHDPLTVKGRLATVLNHPLTVGGAVLRMLRERRAGVGRRAAR